MTDSHQKSWRMHPYWKSATLLVTVGLLISQLGHWLPAMGYSINLSKSLSARWLEVREIQGTAILQLARQSPRTALFSDRLTQVGDQLMTRSRSEVILAVDQGAAIVRLMENTTVQIQKLQIDRVGGNITVLSVPKGMARLQVRPFTHPSSRLDIQTPAGVAGVRGTDYGIIVNPSGKTTVATQSGAVAVSAQSETQIVRAEQYSLMKPGFPPTPPRPLVKDLKLTLLKLNPNVEENQVRSTEIVGRINPANGLWLNGTMTDTDESGQFNQTISVPESQWISVLVRTPMGAEQLYKIFVSPNALTSPTTLESYPNSPTP